MICEEKGLLFIHVPKTSGTVLSRTIFKPTGHPHLGIPGLRKFHSDLEWDSLIKFCFLRNPYDRFVSTYKQLVNKKRTPPITHQMNIKDFRDFVLNYWSLMVTGKTDQVPDSNLKIWLQKNVLELEYTAFSPKTYQNYLQEVDGTLGVDFVLDFDFPRSQLRIIDKALIERNRPSISKSIGPILEINKSSYDNYWDHETRSTFTEICKSDIEFYNQLRLKIDMGSSLVSFS
jgi:hypothetical protein